MVEGAKAPAPPQGASVGISSPGGVVQESRSQVQAWEGPEKEGQTGTALGHRSGPAEETGS